MFNKKGLMRNLIFAVFCVLILMVTFALTYQIALEDKQMEMKSNKIKNENFEEKVESCNEACNVNYFIYSFCFKMMAAFFAGGIISDGLFIKFGVI